MKSLLIASMLFLGFCQIGFASARDSIIALLAKAKPDTNLVFRYYETGWQLEGDLPDSALALYNKGLALSRQLHFTKGEIKYYFNATAVYNIKGDFTTSLKLNKLSVVMAQDYGDKHLLASALGNVGGSYDQLNQYDSSVFYFLKSCALCEELRDSAHLAVSYSNLCGSYCALRQYQLSLSYGQKALSLYENGIKNFDYIAALSNIGMAYSYLKNSPKAIEYFKLAYTEARKINNSYAMISSLGNLSEEYMDAKDYAQLKKVSEEQMKLAKELNSPSQLCNAYHVTALYNFYIHQYDNAIANEGNVLVIAQQNNFIKELQRAYTTLSNVYMAKGDIHKGDSLATLSNVYNDKMVNEQLIANSAIHEANFATELQRNKNIIQQQELKQKKTQLIAMILVIAFLIAFGTVVYYAQQLRQKKIEAENIAKESKIQALQHEKQLEATQALLQGEEKERSRLARDLHDGLGGILSSVKHSFNHMRENIVLNEQQSISFNTSVNQLDNSITELRRIAQNMMPANLQLFGLDASLRDLCSSASANEDIKVIYQSFGLENYKRNPSIDLALYRIAQEVIHNTFKHAHASQLIVQLSLASNRLLFTAEDNGKGFDTSTLNNEKGSGFKSMQNRVHILNGQFQLHSNQQGTTINIEIPV